MVGIQAAVFTALLTATAIKDGKTREIPPQLCIAVALVSLLDFRAENLLGLGIALIVYACGVWICPEQIGGGDIKLISAVSMVVGFTATAYGLIIAFTSELLWFLTLRKKAAKQGADQDGLPLAPFLAVGFLIIYFMKIGGYSL